ncbi:MAG: alpha/beta hydrolase [Frankiales bacterium]|nr:alpha/beta hydrolase [Frankiales bacterium]
MGKLSSWTGCDSGFQCATLTVPLDEAKPALGTVGLKLVRRKATGSRRIGSLLVNPGGPGASAIGYLEAVYSSLPKTLRSHFDLVAFDPRGVGRTAPVRCLTTAQLDTFFHVDPAPDNAQEMSAFNAANKQFDQGCEARSARILPYVSTKVVAQDLDRVRQAVGDQKLTYLGYSYGTAIGAAYLDAFPTHVRAMVLDGALDPTLSWDQLLTGQSKGFDVALQAFLDDCQKTSCDFRKAVSGDLGRAYDALAAKVERTELPTGNARKIGPDELSLGVGDALYSKGSWPFLGQALAKAQKGDGSQIQVLSDDYLERTSSGYANTTEANFAVNCVDRPWPRTEQPYVDLAKKVGAAYPRFGPAIALSGAACAYWPVAPANTPHAVTGAGSPPVVVIGTTRDPATPYSWAQALAKQLTKGVLLTHVGDGHTAFHNGQRSCIVDPVNSYLVDLRTPAAATC